MVYILPEAYFYMVALARAACKISSREVGGYLLGGIRGDNLVVDEIVTCKHEKMQPGHFKLDGEGEATMLQSLIESGKIEKYIGMWHSHALMGVMFSNEDDKVTSRTARARARAGGPNWFLHIVTNCDGEMASRIDIVIPVLSSIKIDVEIGNPDMPDEIEQYAKRAEEKIAEIEPPVNVYATGFSYNNHGFYEYDANSYVSSKQGNLFGKEKPIIENASSTGNPVVVKAPGGVQKCKDCKTGNATMRDSENKVTLCVSCNLKRIRLDVAREHDFSGTIQNAKAKQKKNPKEKGIIPSNAYCSGCTYLIDTTKWCTKRKAFISHMATCPLDE